jgi:hypothetical protein
MTNRRARLTLRRAWAVMFTSATFITLAAAISTPARAAVPWWKNCTAVHKRYLHGIGRVGAHDHTSGKPVTTFKRSNKLYTTAVGHNRGLDRDHDGVACESA